MKKRYQIDQQRAAQQLRRLATEQDPNIQTILLEIDARTGIRHKDSRWMF
jgi:hypothetical protein